MVTTEAPTNRVPSRAVSFALAATLILVWAFLRLLVFKSTMFPLTYVLPLLVCVWTRDRIALWGMAIVFAALHAVKLFWLLPPGVMTSVDIWSNATATFANILLGATTVHAIIVFRKRLELALDRVREQAEELGEQGEELAQQNEELSRQTEELSQQGEELTIQNEELQTQAEEIGTLNAALERRERLLQTLLDATRASGGEPAALHQIVAAGLDLFADAPAATVIYERTPAGLRVRAVAPAGSAAGLGEDVACEDGFVALVLDQGRTACLNDAALRPDLALARLADRPPLQSVLCAPIRIGSHTFGAFAVYGPRPRTWTDEEFRLASWLADQSGRVLHALHVQQELREADRRKGEFLAVLSHELRNPLAPIGSALELIATGAERNGNAMQIARRQLRQLVRLVDDLLDATRLSSNKIQVRKIRTDFVRIVRDAIEGVLADIEKAGHEMTITLPSHPVWVDADTDRMAQVIINLLSNATRYTPPGGRLAVDLWVSDAEAVLSVSDSGIGLDTDDLERVFQMFTQVRGPGSGGLGIGLALVHGIVELHGGRVEAQSEGIGRGSRFRITIPIATSSPVEAPMIDGASRSPVATCRVLVVDDNVDSAETLAALLSIHGHVVRVAHDAMEAQSIAIEFAPQVALLDIGLPEIDGYELARRLRHDARTRDIRLIALTGWGAEDDRARAKAAGFDAHLTKPADPNSLLAAIVPLAAIHASE